MSGNLRNGRVLGTALLVAGLLCLAPGAQAQMATMSVGSGSIEWSARGDFDGMTLTVAGNGYYIEREFTGAAASFAPVDDQGVALPDGTYKWQLIASPSVRSLTRGEFQPGRASANGKYQREAVAPRVPTDFGSFTVVNGAILDPNVEEPRSTRARANAGDMSASGAKNFAVTDPADPSRTIYFAALEGPEAGTYLRGNAATAAGEAAIELPDYFAKVTEAEGLTVQLTPVGGWHQLYVAEVSPGHLVVRDAAGGDGVEFSFFVQGVRKGYLDYQVERSAADLDPR